MNATSGTEIAPTLREFYCPKCFEDIFIADIIKQDYKTVTITINALKAITDEKTGIEWAVVCQGQDENTFSPLHHTHLAKFEVIRHSIVSTPVVTVPIEVV